MRSALSLLQGFVTGAILVSCADLLGIEEGTERVGNTGGGGSGTTATTSTGGQGGTLDPCCVPLVPAMWEGPAALYVGEDPPPPCNDQPQWTPSLTGGVAVASNDTPCGCTCGSATGDCTNAGVMVPMAEYTAAACDGQQESGSVSDTCSPFNPSSPGQVGAQSGSGSPASASCQAVSTGMPAPSTWATYAQLCDATATQPCADALCPTNLPSGYGSVRCIYREGEQACPPGPYDEQHIFYQTFDDSTRSCSCRCDTNPLVCQAEVVTLYEQPDCEGTEVLLTAGGSCVSISTNVQTARVTSSELVGDCMAVAEAIAGAATLDNPVTVCCER